MSKKALRWIDTLRNKDEAIVVISHNLDYAFPVAARITIMRNRALVGVIRTAETMRGDVVAMVISGHMPGTA